MGDVAWAKQPAGEGFKGHGVQPESGHVCTRELQHSMVLKYRTHVLSYRSMPHLPSAAVRALKLKADDAWSTCAEVA